MVRPTKAIVSPQVTPSCGPQGAEDWVRRVPWPLRSVAESIHMRLSEMPVAAINARLVGRYIDVQPGPAAYQAAMSGKTVDDRVDGWRDLAADIFFRPNQFIVAGWAKAPIDNPQVQRTLRRICDSVLGPQPSAAAANRAARRLMAGAHPDTIARLQHRRMGPRQRSRAQDQFAFLADLRTLLSHPVMGRRIYAEHRLAYGQKTVPPAAVFAASLGAAGLAFITGSFWWLLIGSVLGAVPAVKALLPRGHVC